MMLYLYTIWHVAFFVSISPDVVPSGWLGLKHQLTNCLSASFWFALSLVSYLKKKKKEKKKVFMLFPLCVCVYIFNWLIVRYNINNNKSCFNIVFRIFFFFFCYFRGWVSIIFLWQSSVAIDAWQWTMHWTPGDCCQLHSSPVSQG